MEHQNWHFTPCWRSVSINYNTLWQKMHHQMQNTENTGVLKAISDFLKSCGKWQRVGNSFRNVQQIEKCKIHTIHFWCLYRDNNDACNAWDTAMYLAIHIKSSVQEIIRLDVLIHLDTLSESYGFVSAIHLPLQFIKYSLRENLF